MIDPLGLTHTLVTLEEAVASGDLAFGRGYVPITVDWTNPFADNQWVFTIVEPGDMEDSAFVRPAGTLWSTPTDLVALGAFLLEGDPDVLADDLRGEATRAHVPTDPCGDGLSYGYGLYVSPGLYTAAGHRVVTVWLHPGNSLTHTAFLLVLPEQELVVAVAASMYGAELTVVLDAVLDAVGDVPPAGPPPALGEELPHDAYVGTYTDPLIGTFTVSDQDGALTIDQEFFHFPDWSPNEVLQYYCPDLYVFYPSPGVPIDLSFYDADGGYLVNRNLVGVRE